MRNDQELRGLQAQFLVQWLDELNPYKNINLLNLGT